MPVLAPRVAARGHRVAEDEERGPITAAHAELLHERRALVLEHRLEPTPADVAIRRPVEGVAHRHVVGRDRLRHRAGRTADAEEPAGHFLPRADLGAGAILRRVEVDATRLVVRAGGRLPWDLRAVRRGWGPHGS